LKRRAEYILNAKERLLVRKRPIVQEPDIKTLHAFVAEGIADVEAGRILDAEEVYARVLARINQLAIQKNSG
jgi:predicted transcriptional regulator